MHSFKRLDEAILTTLGASITSLQEQDPDLVFVACGMVEDLTGFFVTGTGRAWITGLEGSTQDRATYLWYPSEWPLAGEDPGDQAPGRVTKAIWELSGTQTMLDGTGQELEDDQYSALRESYVERIVLAIEQLRGPEALPPCLSRFCQNPDGKPSSVEIKMILTSLGKKNGALVRPKRHNY